MGLIANDQLTNKYCQLVGSLALVVLAIHDGEFRKSLFRLTFLFLAFILICIVKSTHPHRTLKTA